MSLDSALGEDDFAVLCARVRRLCGIDLLQYRRVQMERRVRSWARRRGADSLAVYGERLRHDPDELDAFLDRVTINVSHLWRHEDQWESLRTDVLPPLAALGRVRAWSAGCSYGAEAYTLAAVCRETAPGARVEIVGTDLDRRVVDRARVGVFSAEDARAAPDAALARHFEPTRSGGWRARPELQAMVRFEVGDLLRMPIDCDRYDLVLCRNTVIYFTEQVRDALHRRLVDALGSGGHLVIGTSERIVDLDGLGLERTHRFIYRKR